MQHRKLGYRIRPHRALHQRCRRTAAARLHLPAPGLIIHAGLPAAIIAGVVGGVLSELVKDTLKGLGLWPGAEAPKPVFAALPEHQEYTSELQSQGYDVNEIYCGEWAPSSMAEVMPDEYGSPDQEDDEQGNQDDNEEADRLVERHFGSRYPSGFELSEAILDDRYRTFTSSRLAGQSGSVDLERGDIIAQYLLTTAIARVGGVDNMVDWALPIATLGEPTFDRLKLNHLNPSNLATPNGRVTWENSGFGTADPRITAASIDDDGNTRIAFEFRTDGRPDKWVYTRI